jgi:hypothetical protein
MLLSGINALFIDDTQSLVGNTQANPTIFTLHPKAVVVNIGQKASLGLHI